MHLSNVWRAVDNGIPLPPLVKMNVSALTGIGGFLRPLVAIIEFSAVS